MEINQKDIPTGSAEDKL